jgi:DNA mismatch repair protein MutS
MAGKSTYMRQIALITLMAHIGSFVPAENANICVVDKIFTRIGASDDISSGRSTYMVEMTEVKNILDNATKFSLVLLDEVGRGTSTSDGLSIAQAVSEYIYNNIGCKTLFATHYHELIALEEQLKGLRNYHMSVNKENGSLEFVRKLEVGGLSESYGIDVAELAGLPNSVIERAWEILRVVDGDKKEKLSELKVVDNTNDSVIEKLKGLDKSDLSAVSAYRILCDLIDSVK